jgi:hypothetical protein
LNRRTIEVSLPACLTYETSYRGINDVIIMLQFFVHVLFSNVFAMAEYAGGHNFRIPGGEEFGFARHQGILNPMTGDGV